MGVGLWETENTKERRRGKESKTMITIEPAEITMPGNKHVFFCIESIVFAIVSLYGSVYYKTLSARITTLVVNNNQ